MTIDIDAIRAELADAHAYLTRRDLDDVAQVRLLVEQRDTAKAERNEALAELDRVRADLAAAKAEHKVHNNACVEEKEDLRAELDRLRAVLAEAQRMAHAFDTPRDSSRVRVFVGDLRHVLHKGETQP